MTPVDELESGAPALPGAERARDEPRQAIGVDAGEGLIFRYDEATERLVGLTIVGVQVRLAQRSAGR